MVLPVMLAAMSPSDHPLRVGRRQHSSKDSVTTSQTCMFHQGRRASGQTIHSQRDSEGRVFPNREHGSQHEEDTHSDRSAKRGYLSVRTFRGVAFALILVHLLLAGHFHGASALSCDFCDRSSCVNQTSCPGGMVLDVCHCCLVCARGLNQSCGGAFGILGKCDRNLHCFIRNPDSPNRDGICKGKS